MPNKKANHLPSQTEIILDSIADGVFKVDNSWRISSINSAAEKITGVIKDEAIGSTCRDVFHSNICDGNCILKSSLQKNELITNKPIYIINANGEQIPISISAAPLKDSSGKIIGGIETFRDLSELNELRKELEKKYSFQNIISKSKIVLLLKISISIKIKMGCLFTITAQLLQSTITSILQIFFFILIPKLYNC